jgi:hypothetical protein
MAIINTDIQEVGTDKTDRSLYKDDSGKASA